jgi:deazaflavin-dependent oxidoreductase (nitroreductase family)
VHPVVYLADADGPDTIYVFATNSGALSNPDWYRNLVVSGEGAVELGSETYPVSVRELTGAERDRIYKEQARRNPVLAEYTQKAAGVRAIPVLALTCQAAKPRPGCPPPAPPGRRPGSRDDRHPAPRRRVRHPRCLTCTPRTVISIARTGSGTCDRRTAATPAHRAGRQLLIDGDDVDLRVTEKPVYDILPGRPEAGLDDDAQLNPDGSGHQPDQGMLKVGGEILASRLAEDHGYARRRVNDEAPAALRLRLSQCWCSSSTVGPPAAWRTRPGGAVR